MEKESSSTLKKAKQSLHRLHDENGNVIDEVRFVGPPGDLPLIMERIPPLIKPQKESNSLVVSKAVFETKFKSFTGNALSKFTANDWNNMIVAGGSVVAGLVGCNHHLFADADVDIFLYGLTEGEARKKIERIWELAKSSGKNFCIRTPHTLTFVASPPRRHIQIVLRLNESPEQIIEEFDVDVCSVFYDGKDVYGIDRSCRAFSTRVNVVDLSFRSWSYEKRLIKYAKRGFSIGVPGLRREDIELREYLDVTVSRCSLPKDHPMYYDAGPADEEVEVERVYGDKVVKSMTRRRFLPRDDPRYIDDTPRYQGVTVGQKLGFADSYTEKEDEPTSEEYFNSTGLRRLLLAELAQKTMGFVGSIGDNYGPSVYWLPKPLQKYGKASNPTTFLTKSSNKCYVTFEASISRGQYDVTNADWEQGIYKDRLVPKPDLPIIGDEASSTSASYAGADDDDDAGAGAKVRKYSLDYFCGHIITHLLPHMTNNYPTHMNKASGEGRGQGRASAIDVDL